MSINAASLDASNRKPLLTPAPGVPGGHGLVSYDAVSHSADNGAANVGRIYPDLNQNQVDNRASNVAISVLNSEQIEGGNNEGVAQRVRRHCSYSNYGPYYGGAVFALTLMGLVGTALWAMVDPF